MFSSKAAVAFLAHIASIAPNTLYLCQVVAGIQKVQNLVGDNNWDGYSLHILRNFKFFKKNFSKKF